MKYIGVSTPAYSFTSEKKATLQPLDSITKDAPLTDIRALVHKNRCRNLSWTMSKGKRGFQEKVKDTGPAVGQYDLYPEKVVTEKLDRFGRNTYQKFKSTQNYKNEYLDRPVVPGVGAYDIAGDPFPQMMKSFGYRFDTMEGLSKNPGPGAYELNNVTIEKDLEKRKKLYKRRQMLRKERDEAPPRKRKEEDPMNHTAYQLPDSFDELRKISSKKGTLSLSLTTRVSDSNEKSTKGTPGPGEYSIVVDHLRESMEKGKGFTALGKNKPIKTSASSTPGPGSYSHKSSITPNKSFSIGNAKKDLSYLLRGLVPGPGEYDVMDMKTVKSISLTKSARRVGLMDKTHFTFVPGPGTYSVRTDKTSGPKYSLTFKKKTGSYHTDSTFEKTVGPGTYEPQFTQTKPDIYAKSFTKSIRPSSKTTKATPGVGDYNIDVDDIATVKTGMTIPNAQRGLLPEEYNEVFPEPGPGAYTLKHTIPQLQTFEQDKMDITGWKISL